MRRGVVALGEPPGEDGQLARAHDVSTAKANALFSMCSAIVG
jgi:hypothetical protein